MRSTHTSPQSTHGVHHAASETALTPQNSEVNLSCSYPHRRYVRAMLGLALLHTLEVTLASGTASSVPLH